MIFSSARSLVLASGSAYRRALLDRIGLTYTVCPADIDESPLAGEAPAAVAARLAREKARAVALKYPGSLIIGSDQVATLDGNIMFGKPLDHPTAVDQLTSMSGRSPIFHTAVCLLDAHTGEEREANVPTEVRFRTLSRKTIEAYLRADRPYDCAGSAKIEGLGIVLVRRVVSDDPTALMGLPLIALTDLLAQAGAIVL